MSDKGLRLVLFNGLLLVLAGLVVAGFPLAFVIQKELYHQEPPFWPGGDVRGWSMAHLEGILNGFLIMGLAACTRAGGALKAGREVWLVPALLLMGWGNMLGSVLAPILGVRGIAMNSDIGNNVVMVIFFGGVIPTFAAFWGVMAHLARPGGKGAAA